METIQENVSNEQAIGPLPPPKKAMEDILEENELSFEVINGIPNYQTEHVIDGIVKVFERIGYDDRFGATFLGIGADGKELVIRVGPSEETTHVVRMEASFLCKVEAENDWRLFSQVHKIFHTDDAFHMTLYFRGGPTLEQCISLRNKFTFGTAGRLAFDVLEIIECAHKHGYIVRNVNPDCFHYDAASRHLFMADISSLVKDVSKCGLNIEEPVAAYAGNSDFAPIIHHENKKVSARQDLESWLYLFVYMAKGTLPWISLKAEDVGPSKSKSFDKTLFEDLPEQFLQLAKIVKPEDVYKPIAQEEYEHLKNLTKQIYEEIGGITDHEENMDFEREPTPEETPRLVLCRDDEVEKEADNDSK